jgi:hypothetical protein
MYAFAETPSIVAEYRGMLKTELGLMKREYEALLYGGTVDTMVCVCVWGGGLALRQLLLGAVVDVSDVTVC